MEETRRLIPGYWKIVPALAAVALLSILPAQATVLDVPSDPYPTIQAGLDAAQPGDTVLVAAGTYHGEGNSNLEFGGKDIVLLSESGAEQTVIEPEGRGFTFYESGETSAAVIDGFTVRYGYGQEGGGMLCEDASPTVRDCVFEMCSAYNRGGGIKVRTEVPMEITGCTVRNCWAGGWDQDTGYGGGLYLWGPVTLKECRIAGNHVQSSSYPGEGGGAYMFGPGGSLTDCVIENNSVDVPEWDFFGRGGGIAGNPDTIVRCRITGNYGGGEGGGLLISHAEIVECLIAGNLARNRGAGIASNGGDVTIRSSTIASNLTTGGDEDRVGGGVWVGDGGAVHVVRSILWGNCAEAGGDQISASGFLASAHFYCSAVDTAGVAGEAVYGQGNIFVDPLFCDPGPCDEAPTLAGDFTLSSDSPCLPGNHPDGFQECGLVGSLPVGCPVTGLPEGPRDDRSAAISLEIPNPFRSGSKLTVTVVPRREERSEMLSLRIHDASGRAVRSLYRGELPSGPRSFTWEGTDDRGRPVAAGIYFVRADFAGRTEGRSFLLVP
ncbi:MAG: hypothetical protein GF346_07700 [Candidatus Eisenbacteria bacterium]|nr:hypothetical protein [Candidatus Latescibacterota bacterium]MBD3302316.1 hypothetical protein [Candidatus Eisenbacteria bacterium]